MEILKTEKISINFGGLVAVKDVDFSVKEGEIVGLIGPNGSGKTTFFNLITGIYKPTSGNIFFDGENIAGLPPHKITKKGIARTFQNTRLFWDLSALDNVLLGMHRWQSFSWYNSMFRRNYTAQGLRKNVEESFNLFNDFVGKELVDRMYQKVRDLSQADKKRVEICRALASKPKLLLLDEPSAGMNPEETIGLMEDIKKIKKRNAKIDIIIIEHDMRVIKGITQNVVVFNYGKKIFEGTFEEASANKEVRQAYLGGEI